MVTFELCFGTPTTGALDFFGAVDFDVVVGVAAAVVAELAGTVDSICAPHTSSTVEAGSSTFFM